MNETTADTYPVMPGRGDYSEEARRARLRWLRETSGAGLPSLEHSSIDPRSLPGNVENVVGGIELPVGLAGPLLLNGGHVQGLVTAPLATTEGAMVASVSRGAKAITLAGGATVQVIAQRMTRVPVFEFDGLGTAARFARWAVAQKSELDRQIATVSRHSRLVELDPVQLGRAVHLRFVYETADASGQNMTTAATWQACRWIHDRLSETADLVPTWFAVEANLSGDKKFTHLNMIGGRGTRVMAECVIDRATVRRTLKTTPEAVDRLYRISVVAAQQAGMPGHDIDAANVIAAMFVATGQDIASVYESGTALFSLEVEDGALRATLVLPNLVTGAVGGGTGLPQQRDYLAALGCSGDGTGARFAEIVCGFALALDVSTMAAVAGGQFADAHERLGRARRVDWLRADDLGAPLLQPMLAESFGAPDLRVTGVEPIGDAPRSSLVTELTARGERRKTVGVLPLRVTWVRRHGEDPKQTEVVVKAKPLDREVIIEAAKLASLCGGRLAEVYPRWRDWTGFRGLHTREPAIYRSSVPALRAVLPTTYGTYEDPGREAYVIAMERLGPNVILKDAGDAPGRWRGAHIAAAVRGIAGVHAAWLGREAELRAEEWLGDVRTAERMTVMRELWEALLDHGAAEHPEVLDEAGARRLRRIIAEIPAWWSRLEAMPRTLVHGDFNPRNVALRAADLSLVAYDWELATLHVPQRDLAEFLAFVLPADVAEPDVTAFVDLHRDTLGAGIDPATWRAGYRLALWDFAVTRLLLYLMVHTHRALPFLGRLTATTLRLIAIEDEVAG
ncbi:phosphotransferase [Actinomadura fulvescens]|uniref:Aminoglycoside phosphotransferase domain-containing protein n=1 Tax=Actinomadura fulvescens TaxID=46160 RepID=A0ABN3QXQ2_9ACTN